MVALHRYVAMFASLAVLLIQARASAANAKYYVSTSGDDTKSGNDEANAWRSLSKLSSMTFAPGDQIFLERGDVWTASSPLTPALTLRGSGVASNRIKLGWYGALSSAKPLIQGYSSPGAVRQKQVLVLVDDAAYWDIDGIQLRRGWRGIELRFNDQGSKPSIHISGVDIADMIMDAGCVPSFTDVGAGIAIARWKSGATSDLQVTGTTIADSDMGIWGGWYCGDNNENCQDNTGNPPSCAPQNFPTGAAGPITGALIQDVMITNALINGFHMHGMFDSDVRRVTVNGAGSRYWGCAKGSAGYSIARSADVRFDSANAFNVVRPTAPQGNDGVGFDCSLQNARIEVKNSQFENLDGQGFATYSLEAEKHPGCQDFTFHDNVITNFGRNPQLDPNNPSAPAAPVARAAVSLITQQSTGASCVRCNYSGCSDPCRGNYNTGDIWNVTINRGRFPTVETTPEFVFCGTGDQCYYQVDYDYASILHTDVRSIGRPIAASSSYGNSFSPQKANDWNWSSSWFASSYSPSSIWMDLGSSQRIGRIQNNFANTAPWRVRFWGSNDVGATWELLADNTGAVTNTGSFALNAFAWTNLRYRWVRLEFVGPPPMLPSSSEFVVFAE